MWVEIGAGGRCERSINVLDRHFGAENVVDVDVSGVWLGEHVLIYQVLDLLSVALVVAVAQEVNGFLTPGD